MMKSKTIVRWVLGLATVAAAFLAEPTFAQTAAGAPKVANTGSLDLGQFLKEVEAQSPVLAKSHAATAAAEARHRGSLQGFLPSVSGSVTYLLDKKYVLLDTNVGGAPITIPQVMPTTNYVLQASYPLFEGFQSVNRYSATSHGLEAARSEDRWAAFSISRQATLGFYRALATQVLKDVAEQNLKGIKDHLKDTNALKRAGVSTNYDVLRVETQVSEAESEALNAEDNVQMAQLKLGEALGERNEARRLVGQLPVLEAKVIEALKNQDVNQREDLFALNERTEASGRMAQAADAHWYPRLSLIGQYQYYNNINDRFDDSDRFRNAYYTGLNLNWNFFDGFASSSRATEAHQEALIQDKNLQLARIKAYQDSELWKRKFKYFCTIYQARQNDVNRSTEAVRLAAAGRRAGTRTSTELLDAETDLFRARAGVVNAQIGAIEALIQLELATGQQLYNFN